MACLQLFRECNYTGREIGEGTAKEAADSISIADETVVRGGLLAMGGEDIEEVVVARELLYFALSVFKCSEYNICSKSWVSTKLGGLVTLCNVRIAQIFWAKLHLICFIRHDRQILENVKR